MPYTTVQNSSFLDAYGNNLYSAAQFQAMSNGVTDATQALQQLFKSVTGQTPTDVRSSFTDTFTVGLVLDRKVDPTAVGEALSGNWAQRQVALANQTEVFAKYGADANQYETARAAIEGIVGREALNSATNTGYISSAADRTIWMTLTQQQFQELFGKELLKVTFTIWDSKPPAGSTSGTGQYTQHSVLAWSGDLGLNDKISASAIKGLWIEQGVGITTPLVRDFNLVPLPAGPVGIGNSTNNKWPATPAAIGANYDFPLPAGVATDPIALVEPYILQPAQLLNDLNAYRAQINLPALTSEQFRIISGGGLGASSVTGELTLDISVVTSAVPRSTQLIYSELTGTPFTAYQQAFFDTNYDPSVLTSSYSTAGQPSAASPFQWAYQQLFVDGALSRVSTHIAGGDQGGGADIANGIANVANTHTSPYALIVGGTSIASLYSAQSDPTLSNLLSLAQQNNPATLFMLMASGLKSLPSNLSPAGPSPGNASTTLTTLFESVWQSLALTQSGNTLQGIFGANETGAGGIATTVAIPGYQSVFGVSSKTGNSRGVPDVAALSSGDSGYAVLNKDYVNDQPGASVITTDGGTSAATPLWASLTTQFNKIFGDQGLPKLGYYNDLLYNAAVIAPAAFNDIQLGTNNNSYYSTDQATGYFNTNTQMNMAPTNQGQAATPGYDLTSGLGTPNATLLARALTWIAHDQTSYGGVPDLISSNGQGGWTSGANQSLLLQATAPIDGARIGVNIGGTSASLASQASDAYAWTSRLAQQSLQSDFDGGLAILFDKQAQGALSQSQIATGQGLSVSIDSGATQATQASFSTSFGFADFSAGADSLRVARAVTVAETVGGGNDQLAVVRVRQVGADNLSVTFFKVDNFSGAIGDLQPGDAGYQAAIQARAYQLTSGGTSLNGPGYGQYSQTMLQNVDSGDLIAMQLTNLTRGAVYSAFAQANEIGANGQRVGHLWSYGANTFGWEDTLGGGDRDYNDFVIQIDPTSAYANGWLI